MLDASQDMPDVFRTKVESDLSPLVHYVVGMNECTDGKCPHHFSQSRTCNIFETLGAQSFMIIYTITIWVGQGGSQCTYKNDCRNLRVNF